MIGIRRDVAGKNKKDEKKLSYNEYDMFISE